MKRSTNDDRGQILVVVAAGLVVLLAVAALVVDLGFSWMLRRQEQNAADPGSIAAARWLKDDLGNARSPFPEAYSEACFYAQQNGFFEGDTSDCATARTAGQLRVHWPPVSGDYSGNRDAIQVIITDTHPSFFARIFGQDVATVSTDAVALNSAGGGNSSSLVALQDVCTGGSAGTVTGGGTVSIFPVTPGTVGGYVHVNSPCGTSTSDDQCLGGSGQRALDINGGSVLITPFAYTVGGCATNGGGVLQCDPLIGGPCLDEAAVPLADPLKNLPEPPLSAFPTGVCPDGTILSAATSTGCALDRGPDCPPDPLDPTIDICTLAPGVYYGGWRVGSKVHLELQPGLYILAGGGIRLQGTDASIAAVTSPTGVDARVTIFSTDGPNCTTAGSRQCQGEIRFGAEQAFRAKATNTATCQAILAAGGPDTCPWKGILLWQDGTVRFPGSDVTLGGQSSTILAGTIYAPASDVQINGGSATTGCSGPPESQSCLSVQIISWTWTIDGDASVAMPYDPSELYQFPGRGLVE
jgi:hypothetical protein